MNDTETLSPLGPVQEAVDATPGSPVATGTGPTDARPAGPARYKGMERLRATLRGGGLYYTAVYAARWLVGSLLEAIDRHLVSIEQRKRLVEPWTILARRNTVDQNKQWWNRYDWTKLGEEWTQSEEWKQQIIDELLVPNVPEGGTVVEIGPGGGRWTETLVERVARLYVVDISESVLDVCRRRFAGCANIEHLLTTGSRIDVPDASIDAIWSYDVFVHIDPLTVRDYLREFQRILRPGARAVIHHAGPALPEYRKRRQLGWRSDLTDAMVADFARECGLEVAQQRPEPAHKEKGDVLTILRKPGAGAR